MSYAHTKRRKTIAKLKRNYPLSHQWVIKQQEIGEDVRAKQDGPCLGTLEDIMKATKKVYYDE